MRSVCHVFRWLWKGVQMTDGADKVIRPHRGGYGWEPGNDV